MLWLDGALGFCLLGRDSVCRREGSEHLWVRKQPVVDWQSSYSFSVFTAPPSGPLTVGDLSPHLIDTRLGHMTRSGQWVVSRSLECHLHLPPATRMMYSRGGFAPSAWIPKWRGCRAEPQPAHYWEVTQKKYTSLLWATEIWGCCYHSITRRRSRINLWMVYIKAKQV